MTQSTNKLASFATTKGRIAAAVLVAGGLATTLGVTGASGAVHSHAKGIVVSTAKSAKYGTILVSTDTVYTLKPNASPCTSACHKIWIQVLLPKGVTKATAGTGVSAAKLGTVKVAGGRLQVTYGGRALYWFFKDKFGQVKGNVTDTWGKWSDIVLAKPTGKKPTTTTTAPPGGGGVGF
jgi:predicted lipoprotein with Yx(FWY)xxD motif